MNTRESLNAPLLTSIAAVSLLTITLLMTVPPLLAAAFGGSARGQEPSDTVASLVQEHDELLGTYKARFNGRSVFFRPPAPAQPRPQTRPEPQPEPVREEPPPPPPAGPPPPPASYQGPPVSVVLGNKVLFKGTGPRDSGKWISVGEEVDGLKVLETNAPRSVRVAYQRGEYDVPVFNWDMPFFRDAAEARKPIEGLIIGAADSRPPSPQQPAAPRSRERGRAVPVQPSPGSLEPPMDDEDAHRRAIEEQGLDPDEWEETDFHPAGDPDVPEFDPEFDPDFDPETEIPEEDPENPDAPEDPESSDTPDDPDDPESGQQKETPANDDPKASQQGGMMQ